MRSDNLFLFCLVNTIVNEYTTLRWRKFVAQVNDFGGVNVF